MKASSLECIAEADETCKLKFCKGQRAPLRQKGCKARRRGGRATRRGMSIEHDVALVARDRSGATTDQIVPSLDTAHLAAVLQPLLPSDTMVRTDGSGALSAAARLIGVEHHAVDASAGQRVRGAWHINNANGDHSRLKNWLQRFNGVASSNLRNDLGWSRILDRFSSTGLKSAALLALAIGP